MVVCFPLIPQKLFKFLECYNQLKNIDYMLYYISGASLRFLKLYFYWYPIGTP